LNKEAARKVILARVEELNTHYGFRYGRIAIRSQRSRWGSCSKKGNLNFNYKIVELPQELMDYVIVHELCHLSEFNHSRAFWFLVSKRIPNHRTLRTALHNHHPLLK
jgi:hypothetical protein